VTALHWLLPPLPLFPVLFLGLPRDPLHTSMCSHTLSAMCFLLSHGLIGGSRPEKPLEAPSTPQLPVLPPQCWCLWGALPHPPAPTHCPQSCVDQGAVSLGRLQSHCVWNAAASTQEQTECSPFPPSVTTAAESCFLHLLQRWKLPVVASACSFSFPGAKDEMSEITIPTPASEIPSRVTFAHQSVTHITLNGIWSGRSEALKQALFRLQWGTL